MTAPTTSRRNSGRNFTAISITHTTASADADYNAIGVSSVTANITHNDTAAVTITESAASTSPDQQTNDVTRAILYVANERIFSTVFWFAIFGPFGCMLYRLISELSKQLEYDELAEFSEFIHAIMAWIPARMLAAGYALTGNFDGAYHAYKDRTHTPGLSQSNKEVLVSTGLGAMRNLDMANELASIYASQALVMRAVIVWIGMLAVMTLGGIFN